ncbi:MAG: hypothetical protein NWP80_01325 [Candidatus Gracilibacteria bacterium]|nr:hypothetical protein [Candidatus Gracilibacteria bacterium]
MNLFYLGPKYRREFLDNILKNCFLEYQDLLKKYEIILKSRNKLLKNINLGLSKIDEINFWDNNFILLSEKIYKYRIDLINFLKENISENKIFFQNNNVEVSFDYISKTNLGDILGSIKQYLDKNLQRDILIGKTQIGPHIDDFDILINGQKIINFASRGETKSIIMNLKKIEMDYIKLKTLKNPILLIDDLSSELDEKHINSFMKKTNKYQTFLTSILPLNIEELEKINIIKK